MKPFDELFLNECRLITEKYDKLMGTWSVDSGILHVHSELSEVKEVLRNKNYKYGMIGSKIYNDKLLDEIADVFLTALSLTNILAITNSELNNALQQKLDVVKLRVKSFEVSL